MKVLQVIPGIGKAAGTSVFCGELSNQLVSVGHDVSVAVCDPKCSDVYPLDPRVCLTSIDSILRTLSVTANSNIVHIHALWSPILHEVAKWARQNQIPIVWSPHGMLTPWAMNNKRWKKLLGWHLYQKCDLRSAALLHATAQSEVEDIRRLGLKNRVVIAPLGVRLPPEQTRTFKHSNIRTLLFVSRVQRKKGLPNLIDAWSQLPDDLRKGWQVRIVGPEQDGHVAELKVQCNRLGISWYDCLSQSKNRRIEHSNIIFVGPKYDAELSAEYVAADLFVLPTHSENFGSVVIEALAHGVPVITTKQAPWAELDEFRCGWWVDDNVDSLIAALCEAIVSNDLREKGLRGRRLVAERYTWAAVCDKMVRGYEEVLNGRA